jgi:hypothetical protein
MDLRPLPPLLVEFAEAEIGVHRVPGAAIGVLHEGVMYAGAVGITNVDHPLPDARERLQIG